MEYSQDIIEQIISYCAGKPGAYETRPFGEGSLCYKVMGKIFAQLHTQQSFYKITLKCEPERGEGYRYLYPGVVVRGYHCPPVQQPYWNTIDLHAFDDNNALLQMIDEAYLAVTKKFSKKDKNQLLTLIEYEYCETDGNDTNFSMLCSRLDEALDELVGKKFQRSEYDQYHECHNIHDVIVVYHTGKPIACGSFKLFDDEHAELKRIYVEPQYRGFGLGAEIVRRLEAKAKIKGYKWCILETSEPLQAAIHTYYKLGYKVITNYGPYVDMPNSVCMERKL